MILSLPSPHLQRIRHCKTIVRLLRNIRPATGPPFSFYTPYTILVMAISCKGQGAPDNKVKGDDERRSG